MKTLQPRKKGNSDLQTKTIYLIIFLYPQMADALLPAPASVTSQECDCKWVRRAMGGSVLHLDIPRDAVSFDCNIKSARGHTSIHMTPWGSRSHYKRWSEESYPPRDRTRHLIENFRAAERRTRAILHNRRISLHQVARAGRMHPARHRDAPLGGATYTTYQPYYEARDGAAHRNYKRTALPPPEGMCGENDMGQGNLATRPLDPQMEGALPLEEGRAPTVADLGPHSPSSMSSSLMPYGMGEDSWSGEDQEQQDQTLDQEEAEEEGNLPVEEATSKLRMGLQVGPAMYQPASPKYMRAEEEEEEEEDVEAPYLAPRDITKAKSYPEDDLLSISSGSLPDLIDLKEEEPLCQPPTSARSGSVICPTTLALNKVTAATPTEELTSSPLSLEKPEGEYTPKATQERPMAKEDIPEESIIHIDDDSEPSPLAKLEAQVDRLLMPPPVDNTLIAAGTLLDLSQGLPKYIGASIPQQHSPEKKRNGVADKKLQDRRKTKRSLKLKVQTVAKMHTGPRDVVHTQEFVRLAGAVAPLPRLVAEETNSNPPQPETPAPPLPAENKEQ